MNIVPKRQILRWKATPMTSLMRWCVCVLLALLLGGAGAAEPGKAGARARPPAPGQRFYRGSWRDFAKEAAELERDAAIAVKANDDHAAFDAFHDLAFVESDRERFVPMLRAAEACVRIGERWLATGHRPESVTYRERIFHLECRGLMEKGYAYQGRLGEGQAQLRRLREELESLHVIEHGGSAASLRDLTELDHWHERSLFVLWGLIEREALYLAWAGRGNETVPMLRTTIEAARGARTGARIDSFYEIQLAPKFADRLNDLGYLREAVGELENFMREWDHEKVRFAEQCWRARLRLAALRSELEGPSELRLREAQEAHERYIEAIGSGRDHWGAGVIVQMRHELHPSAESAAELRRIATQMQNDGEILQSLSTSYESSNLANDVVTPGREKEFIDLLEACRRTGKKSHEPAIYKSYGAYLLSLGRAAEALPIYREALRQVEGFGWRLHIPRYRLAVIDALLRLGDFAAAEAEWAALDRIVAATPDLPPERMLEVWVARVRWLARRGREADAQAALTAARAFADGQELNAWQRRDLNQLDLGAPAPVVVRASRRVEPVSLQPSRVETEAAPGDPQRARFALRNPASTARAGTLVARGPAARLSVASNPRRIVGTGVSGGAMAELRLPVTLLGGEDLPVVLDMEGATRRRGSEIGWKLAWREEGAGAPQTSVWRIRGDDQRFVTAVLNANQLQRNPFYAVSFTHQIVHREARAALENIRFRGSAPVRLECYDAATGRLLAVDAGGNGQFTDPGDLLVDDADANGALDLPFAPDEGIREVEVFAFPSAVGNGRGRLTVDLELLTAAGWEKCARNELDRE